MALPNGELVPGSIYLYAPIKWAPPMFAAWFLVATIVHVWQCIKYKAWKVTILHPICGLLFTVGFAVRSYGAFHYDNIGVYVASTIFIYCAPPVLELANYHVLGRILYYVPYYSPLHPGRTLTTFGFISGIVEVMNAISVSWLANPKVTEGYNRLGHGLMKAALVLQIGVIALFCAIAGVFHRRCINGGITSRKVQGPLVTMYISMALILVRTIYRIVEHFGTIRIPTHPSPDWNPMTLSPILRYEWYFWVFEASFMLVNTVLWNFRHPRYYLPEDYHTYLAQDGRTELQGKGWKDEIPWFMNFIDPCGLAAAVTGRGRDKEKPFWETNGYGTRELAGRHTVNADNV
ncbi:RTA1 domain protein [Clathrospora elynae]|uniref:RTA1 domain protein n=1 Tax=Clathrospora elynae TaxID=706981 RepID=A0A6A5SFV4_9PLEO|nr:RTA1 domain protein [Clathrospora elynae]